jgi:hypothetical protein
MEEIHVERHEGDLRRLTLRAPMDGMVVILSQHRRGGDQVYYDVGDRMAPGTQFMRIVDTNRMQVEGTVNQAESSLFRLGQEASVGLDAYPGSRLPARLFAIGALATTSGRQQYYIRNIPVRVEILKPDSRLLPDLSAHASILVDKAENVLLAPASAVELEHDRAFVRLKKGEVIEKREVVIADSNGTEVAIESGVSEGDTLLYH